MENIQENLLSDLESNLVRASAGKRFINFIVDYIANTIVLSIILYLFSLLSLNLFSESNFLIIFILEIILIGTIYGLFEIVFKGRSFGKLLTGTKVVNLSGTDIDSSTALKRGFSRLVPFEPFSALGEGCNPWHDRWTNTIVIDIKDSFIVEK